MAKVYGIGALLSLSIIASLWWYLLRTQDIGIECASKLDKIHENEELKAACDGYDQIMTRTKEVIENRHDGSPGLINCALAKSNYEQALSKLPFRGKTEEFRKIEKDFEEAC